MERWGDGEMERWKDREMERRRDGEIETRQTEDGEMERWRDGETRLDRQMGRWTKRQTVLGKLICVPNYMPDTVRTHLPSLSMRGSQA